VVSGRGWEARGWVWGRGREIGGWALVCKSARGEVICAGLGWAGRLESRHIPEMWRWVGETIL